jgi:F0F1-type ATP synthase membrane subunit b/b'
VLCIELFGLLFLICKLVIVPVIQYVQQYRRRSNKDQLDHNEKLSLELIQFIQKQIEEALKDRNKKLALELNEREPDSVGLKTVIADATNSNNNIGSD